MDGSEYSLYHKPFTCLLILVLHAHRYPYPCTISFFMKYVLIRICCAKYCNKKSKRKNCMDALVQLCISFKQTLLFQGDIPFAAIHLHARIQRGAGVPVSVEILLRTFLEKQLDPRRRFLFKGAPYLREIKLPTVASPSGHPSLIE